MEGFTIKNENLNILDEVNKGATMGMDAISYISEKVKDNTFKNVLDGEYNKYNDFVTMQEDSVETSKKYL